MINTGYTILVGMGTIRLSSITMFQFINGQIIIALPWFSSLSFAITFRSCSKRMIKVWLSFIAMLARVGLEPSYVLICYIVDLQGRLRRLSPTMGGKDSKMEKV